MQSQRNTLIRSVAGLTGDVAVGVAIASACLWLIEFAALGLFLSFLSWLLAAIVALALSQYLVHPTIKLLLTDRKLDRAVAGLAAQRKLSWPTSARKTPWYNMLDVFGTTKAQQKAWSDVRGFASRFSAARPGACWRFALHPAPPSPSLWGFFVSGALS
jgi:hypothetical protein